MSDERNGVKSDGSGEKDAAACAVPDFVQDLQSGSLG